MKYSFVRGKTLVERHYFDHDIPPVKTEDICQDHPGSVLVLRPSLFRLDFLFFINLLIVVVDYGTSYSRLNETVKPCLFS